MSRTNKERRDDALQALTVHARLMCPSGYVQELKADPKTCIADLLCDLLHLAEARKVSFREALKSAQINYNAEKGPCSSCRGKDHSEEECPKEVSRG